MSIVRPLVDLLLSEKNDSPLDLMEKMSQLKKEYVKIKESEYKNLMNIVKLQLPPDRLRLFEIYREGLLYLAYRPAP